MEKKELNHILAAMLILFATTSFLFILKGEWNLVALTAVFSILLISGNILSKKIIANSLDADVEHEIWTVNRYWFKAHQYIEPKIPAGIIFPLFFSIFSLGLFTVPTILTYEATALKRRVAKRFGYYSYIDMSEWHFSLIGAAGIVFCLLFSVILYLLPYNLEYFAILSTLYAFFNLIPISKLDGAQIFYGSRILYTAVGLLTLLFMFFAFITLTVKFI